MGVSCEFTRIVRFGMVSDKQLIVEKGKPTKIFHAPIEIQIKLIENQKKVIHDQFIFTLNYFQKMPSQITCPHFEITQWAKFAQFLDRHFSDAEISTALSEPKVIYKSQLRYKVISIKKIEKFKSSSF